MTSRSRPFTGVQLGIPPTEFRDEGSRDVVDPEPVERPESLDRGRCSRPAIPASLRRTVLMVGWLFIGAALLGLLMRSIMVGNVWLLGLVALAPILPLGAPCAVVVLTMNRSIRSAVVALGLTAVALLLQAPMVTAQAVPADSVRIRMLTSNLRLGSADPAALVHLVEEQRIDVLTVQELTPAELRRFDEAGLNRVLPYRFTQARPSATGVGLWSRYPLSQAEAVPGFTFAFVTARVHVPGVPVGPTVASVHPAGPFPSTVASWSRDMRRLPRELSRLADETTGAVLVGGDFNATTATKQFRRVLARGYRDAAEQAGSGVTVSYPADEFFPPVIAIDHVLTHRAVAASAGTVAIPGSDHRGLLSEVALPR